MPELPEVETVRRDLQGLLPGRTVEWLRTEGARTFRHKGLPVGDALLAGAGVAGIRRRGKVLFVDLRTGADGLTLVIHLGMSGAFLWEEGDAPGRSVPGRDPTLGASSRERHTHLTIGFDPPGVLRFVDPRTFGWVALVETGDETSLASVSSLGVDALCPRLSPESLASLLEGRRLRLKAALMDQRLVAGLGNIYSDEALHLAGLRWDRPCGGLSFEEVSRLADAVRDVLAEAVLRRGSTLADQQYRDLFGRPGTFQLQHRAYGREGQPCLRCGGTISRERALGRSTFCCPACQS